MMLRMKQTPKRAPKRRNIAVRRRSKRRRVTTNRNPQVEEETMPEPNYEDVEQQTAVPTPAVPTPFVPEELALNENTQSSSQHTFSDPALVRLQEELA